MKNKGFTLIELICTILLLSIIVTLSTVAIVNVINNARERENESSMKLIETAAKDYFAKNEDKYYIANGVNYCIDIQDLVNENLLISKISYDGKDIKDKTIKVTYNNNTYNVAFEEKNNCLLNETKEYTITNLIANGSFEDDNLNWNGDKAIFSNEHADNGKKSLYIKDTTETMGYWYRNTFKNSNNESYSIPRGHKVYYFFKAKSIESSNFVYFLYAYNDDGSLGTITSSAINSVDDKDKFVISSNLYTNNTRKNIIGVQIGSPVKNTSEGYIDSILLIDLTETFGEGKEPSKEWCDQHIEYFDGTTTVYK